MAARPINELMTALDTGPLPLARRRTARRTASGFWLLCGLIALVGVGKVLQADTMDPDAFWHLRVADQLLRDGIGPIVDDLSFASLRSPWTPYSWLAELFMRGVWAVGGFRLATLTTAVAAAAFAVLVAAAARRRVGRSNDLAVAVLCAVAMFFTLPFVSFRPVTFALVVMAIIVLLLVSDRRCPGAVVWAVVPLTVLLTNLHLYSVTIVALAWLTALGAAIERKRWRRTAGLAVAVTLAACCTPMLPGAIRTALDYNAADPMVASPFITEMRPFYTGPTGPIALLLCVTFVGLCVVRRRRLAATDWLWLGLGLALLLRLGRFSPVFAMFATPAFARAMPRLGGQALRRPAVAVVLCGVLGAGLVRLSTTLDETDFDRWLNRNAPTYPTAAAEFVDRAVPARHGRVVNEFNWGGYLSWRLGTRFRVLMDGRTQLYSPHFWLDTHLGTPLTRRRLLAGIRADAAVLPAHDSALADALIDLGWRVAYADDLAVVYLPPAD